ncbi:MAG: iron-containing alcohol dehydrogenase [Bacteroidales bacterium]
MRNFVFYNPVKIIFGKGTITKLEGEIPVDKRVLITYGGGSVLKNGVMTQVREALKNHMCLEFGGIEANPKFHTLMKAVELVKQESIDIILSVGGGSVLDGTKFIAAATYYEGEDAYDICRKGAKIEKAVPICDVITLAATGSEMNSGAVVSNAQTNEKFAFNSPLVFPKFSILDPETLFSLPKEQVANGIVDTYVHVMEQYLTVPVNSPIQDRYSESLLQTLIDEADTLMSDAEPSYDSYANFMWAATCALNGYNAVGVCFDWATHQIGHEITALKELAHARTLAIVLPGVLRTYKEQRQEKLLQYASRVWGVNTGNADADMEEAINKTEQFFNSVGIETKLHKYGFDSSLVTEIRERFEKRKQEFVGGMQVKISDIDKIFESQL